MIAVGLGGQDRSPGQEGAQSLVNIVCESHQCSCAGAFSPSKLRSNGPFGSWQREIFPGSRHPCKGREEKALPCKDPALFHQGVITDLQAKAEASLVLFPCTGLDFGAALPSCVSC